MNFKKEKLCFACSRSNGKKKLYAIAFKVQTNEKKRHKKCLHIPYLDLKMCVQANGDRLLLQHSCLIFANWFNLTFKWIPNVFARSDVCSLVFDSQPSPKTNRKTVWVVRSNTISFEVSSMLFFLCRSISSFVWFLLLRMSMYLNVFVHIILIRISLRCFKCKWTGQFSSLVGWTEKPSIDCLMNWRGTMNDFWLDFFVSPSFVLFTFARREIVAARAIQ